MRQHSPQKRLNPAKQAWINTVQDLKKKREKI